ncbi:MAG: hypothetical protein HRU03_06255 [Nanoarchaeales archaeon]|nr:hypothetical protein [Nanoarchaeales archaeon]
MEEKEIYNCKNMSIYDLKDLLEDFPLNLMYDYFELKRESEIKEIFFKDVKIITLLKNLELNIYLNNNKVEKLKL